METKLSNTQITEPTIKEHLKDIFTFIGEKPDREGLLDTPKRIIKSWKKLYGGYAQDPKEVLVRSFQEGACEEMVGLAEIEFYSTCEHHMLPFFGTIHIGYIPNKKVVGISKLSRLVEVYARRMQIQERMTTEIAQALETHLEPKGVIVICKAQHFCMTARGVEKQKAKMITSAIRGAYEEQAVRSEFISLIQLPI